MNNIKIYNKNSYEIVNSLDIPDLLVLYGSKDNKIVSCYSDSRSCNEYIHNLVNNYDLPLLNTLPKRIYFYREPVIYPELSFGRLKEQKEYDLDGNGNLGFDPEYREELNSLQSKLEPLLDACECQAQKQQED